MRFLWHVFWDHKSWPCKFFKKIKKKEIQKKKKHGGGGGGKEHAMHNAVRHPSEN